MKQLLGLLLTCTLLVAIAPSAEARSWSHTDGAGDMFRLYDQEVDQTAPGRADGDITRVQLNHNKRYVQLFMTVRAMTTDGAIYHFNLENGRHQLRHLRVFGSTNGAAYLEPVQNRYYKPVQCRGTKAAAINRTTRVIAVTVPRTCFNNPKFLRLSSATLVDDDEAHLTYVDDGNTAGLPGEPFPYERPAVYGPWVKRG